MGVYQDGDEKNNMLSDVIARLNQFKHSALVDDWASYPGFVVQTKQGNIEVIFPFAAAELISELNLWLDTPNINMPPINMVQRIVGMKVADKPPLKGVKNLIVVSSAKGGVGKSTTAVNLALALQVLGAKVGILDADIYGPSLPIMLGTQGQHPTSSDGKTMEPIVAHGLFSNSIGYLVSDNDAMVWRGPMASKAFAQLLNETCWPDLDYLVLDMPPGTGDIPLSLAQQFPVTGAIVVTTPQDLALADAVKGVAMFDKVGVPVLGVVENMSYHICSQCGHHEAIFGQNGAVKMAMDCDLPLLAQVPLHISIREDIDNGVPTVVAKPNSEHTTIYRHMALNVVSRLFWQGSPVEETIAIKMSE